MPYSPGFRVAKEKMFWADGIANELKKRIEQNPRLKEIYNKQGLLVYDEKTPSGHIHVGSGRGWIVHDVIAKACRNIGLNAKFVLSSDDMDPYDKPNKDLPESFDKYLGVPFRNIPSPVEGYKSFGDYFFMECVEKFEEIGIDAGIESTGDNYENGIFNEAIKIALDNSDKIKAIFERIYDKPYDRLPFNVVCEKCGKIATTRAIEWDSKDELVHYKCEEDLVSWAEGCGHVGKISPYNGNGKFPWKVEWAAKWFAKGVICEFAGKDHFTKGGSRDIALAISREVFEFPPPYPSTEYNIGKGYEFFTIGGKKMSTSKGSGVTFVDMVKTLPPQMIRYLLVRTRPNAVIDFDPDGTNDLILLFDRFDKTERIFFDKEGGDERDIINNKRIYELSHIGEIPKENPIQIPLTYAATVIQIAGNEDKAIELLQQSGHVDKDMSGIDRHYLLKRLDEAKRWSQNYAPEQFRFRLNETVEGIELTDLQKNVLKALSKVLKTSSFTEKELHDKFYEVAKGNGAEPKDLFLASYNVLINKDKGPRLASFILTIGKDKVADLFDSL